MREFRRLTVAAPLLLAIFAIVPVSAHHSFSATFTNERESVIEGEVSRFSFRNPHVLVYVDVTNDDGSITEWVVEGGSATGFRRQGWSADTIEPGQYVRVEGDATHDGSPMVSLQEIDLLNPDTSEVIARITDGNQGESYQPEIADTLPLTLPGGLPNLSSVWSNMGTRTTRPGQFASVPLSAAGLALQEEFEIANDPQVFCDPVGLVRQLVTPHPVKIEQFDDHVLLTYEEFAGYRKIYLDDREFKGIRTHYGDSISRYEGDTLVIETTNLHANVGTNAGNRLTDQITVVETYSRADVGSGDTTLALSMVVSDPINLSEDLVHNMTYLDQGDYEFIPNDCQQPLRDRTEVHPAMNFFLTSEGPGDGANLGGLSGADAHCTALAGRVGQDDKNWVAYLSMTGANGVNARDRIAGAGPFYNASGVPVAVDIDDLHGDANAVAKLTVISERGQPVNGRGDDPNRHDILTGSDINGMALNSGEDTTCSNWTSNSDGSARVGHFDRVGGGDDPASWNSAHGTRGCSQSDLQGTGGDGLFYCFATD